MTHFFLTSEKLPQFAQKVLILTTKNIENLRIAKWRGLNDGFLDTEHNTILIEDVIGWMPLPSTKTILKKWLDTVKE